VIGVGLLPHSYDDKQSAVVTNSRQLGMTVVRLKHALRMVGLDCAWCHRCEVVVPTTEDDLGNSRCGKCDHVIH